MTQQEDRGQAAPVLFLLFGGTGIAASLRRVEARRRRGPGDVVFRILQKQRQSRDFVRATARRKGFLFPATVVYYAGPLSRR